MTKRLFVAVDLSDEVLITLGGLQRALEQKLPQVRWARAEGIHLTLQFLGEVKEEKIEEIRSALSPVGDAHKPFKISCEGLGAFPKIRFARVIWVGVVGDLDALSALQKDVEKALNGVGFKPEKRDFSPHITIGRVRGGVNPEILQNEVDAKKTENYGASDISEFYLYESILRPEGAKYLKLATIPLRRRQ